MEKRSFCKKELLEYWALLLSLSKAQGAVWILLSICRTGRSADATVCWPQCNTHGRALRDGGSFQLETLVLLCYYEQATRLQDWLMLSDITAGNLKIVGEIFVRKILEALNPQ